MSENFSIPRDWFANLGELAEDPAVRVALRALAAKLAGNLPAVEATPEEAAALIDQGADLPVGHPAGGPIACLKNEHARRAREALVAQAEAARAGKVK